MVKVGSLEKLEGLEISFIVTDFESEMTVIYEGVLPNLFKENSGVVATGSLNSEQNQFIATEILAKHDENYMPRQNRGAKLIFSPIFLEIFFCLFLHFYVELFL